MKVIVVPRLKGTPARVNRKTGVIYISKWHFDQLDPVYRQFIINHEMGHYLFHSRDEEFADEFALQKMLKDGYNLTDILKSVTRTLKNTRSHYGRKLNVLNSLRIYDYLNNNNTKVLKPIYKWNF